MSPLGAFRSLKRSGFEVTNVWPGFNYTGFTAMLQMGSRLTQPLAAVGKVPAAMHRFALTLRRLMKHEEPEGGRIAWDARVAGAVDWIARKPLH